MIADSCSLAGDKIPVRLNLFDFVPIPIKISVNWSLIVRAINESGETIENAAIREEQDAQGIAIVFNHYFSAAF